MQKFHNHLVPQTTNQWLYTIWLIVCLVCVWFIAPIYFNEPEHIFGFPLLYAWCTGIGIIWLIGCMFLGFRIEKEREEFKKNNQI